MLSLWSHLFIRIRLHIKRQTVWSSPSHILSPVCTRLYNPGLHVIVTLRPLNMTQGGAEWPWLLLLVRGRCQNVSFLYQSHGSKTNLSDAVFNGGKGRADLQLSTAFYI